MRVNSGPTRDKQRANTEPTRNQHSPTQVPCTRCERCANRAVWGQPRSKCHAKKTATNRNANLFGPSHSLLSFIKFYISVVNYRFQLWVLNYEWLITYWIVDITYQEMYGYCEYGIKCEVASKWDRHELQVTSKWIRQEAERNATKPKCNRHEHGVKFKNKRPSRLKVHREVALISIISAHPNVLMIFTVVPSSALIFLVFMHFREFQRFCHIFINFVSQFP